ncbi:MAG: NAD(P)/FAD-dependent oxidoreductase [Dehalococcoidia bacterium]|nr:NAD(P)/FAD-dependent oxidoreductase [Dehalococcoidia bacterium]
MSHYDVIVIGAGPAGSRVAYKMTETGRNVAVLERHQTAGGKKCCTGIIGKECVDLFDITGSCILREAKSAKLYAPSGEFLRVNKDDVQAYIVDRAAFDRCLAEKAAAAGAVYLTNTFVNDISVSGEGVEITVSRQGNEEVLTAEVVVIAAGFASKLPQKLGLGHIKDFTVGAQAEVEAHGIDEVEVYCSQKIAPGFFAWLVPISQNRARVGLCAYERPGAYLREFAALLASEGKISADTLSISYGGIPLKPLAKTYTNRVLVVGDAAGQAKPTTGGGIYYGLLCADIASQTIQQAFAVNDFSRRRLSQYEKLWKKKLGRELQIDYFARRLYRRLSDKRINDIFSIIRDNNIHQSLLNSSSMSFDWHGELILDGLKRLDPWRQLIGRYIPAYISKALRHTPPHPPGSPS